MKFEQREGRVNRYQGYSNRLRLSEYIDKKHKGYKFNGWHAAFKYIGEEEKNIKEKSKGLFPDYAIPSEGDNFALVREGYYYPGSFEAFFLSTVLKTVGYYRSLLGQSGTDTFEENFQKFIKNIPPEEICEYFINLYPNLAKGQNME